MKATRTSRHRHKVALWCFALAFVGFALRPAWYGTQSLGHYLKFGSERWWVYGRFAVMQVGPLVVAIGLMALLWRIFGPPFLQPRQESPEASPTDEPAARNIPPPWKGFGSRTARGRRVERSDETRWLWLFAIAFLCLGANRAWAWMQDLWTAVNYQTSIVGEFAWTAVTGALPFVLSVFQVTSLWKTSALPLPQPEEMGPLALGEESPQDELPLRRSCESPAEAERLAVEESEALKFWRGVLWVVILVLLIGAAGWALISVACALFVPNFGSESLGKMVGQGLVPLAGILVLTALLWLVLGPPFSRPRRD